MLKRYPIFGVVGLILAILTVPTLAKSRAILENTAGSLIFEDSALTIKKSGKKVALLQQVLVNYESVEVWTVESSDVNSIHLLGVLPASADFYRVPTDTQKRYIKLTISKLNSGFRLYAAPGWGRQFTLEFAYLNDHFFGLSAPLQPDNRLSPDLTGKTTLVDIYSEGAAYRENYASAYSPFFISSNGYGAFFDTFARGRYELGINGKNRIHHDTGILDWYVFLGDDGVDIHRAYYDVVGEPKKVPAWVLGPVGWRDQNEGGAREIVQDIQKLSDMEIPFTSWFVDRPYSDGSHAWSQMNFSEKFSNPKQWIGKIRNDYHMEFMTWVSPATFGDTRFNKHLQGKFSYIDLSDEKSVNQYQSELNKKHYSVGVKGHKIDRADEGFPVSEEWSDNTPVAERRNKYAYLMAKAHHEVLQSSWGEDQVTFARTAIHRTQPYLTAIWGGDPRTTWEGLQGNFANAMRSSFMGFPLWGTDVGGYQGEGYIPQDLYLRWMQAGSMTGLFEIKLDGAGGEGRDRMPWQYDDDFQAQFKAICDDRMRWLPYFYSLANTSAQTGVMMQPMAYRHLGDKNTYAIWDQFYVGDAILVAPVFNAKHSRDVYLPKGLWRDLDDPSLIYKGAKKHRISAAIGKLPRFVKENAIYVTGNIIRGNDQLWNHASNSLDLHFNPATKKGSTEFVYVDVLDGDAKKVVSMSRKGKEITLIVPNLIGLSNVAVFVDRAPKSVLVDGQNTTFEYDEASNLVSLTWPKQSLANVIIQL